MSNTAASEIRSLVATYALAVVSRDGKSWQSTWAENGIWELMGQTHQGRDHLLEHWNGLMGNLPFVYQLPGEGEIEIDASGKRGTGRFPTVEFAKFGDGPGNLLLGTYHDEYVVENGRWLFARRRMQIHYMGPSDLSGAPVPR